MGTGLKSLSFQIFGCEGKGSIVYSGSCGLLRQTQASGVSVVRRTPPHVLSSWSVIHAFPAAAAAVMQTVKDLDCWRCAQAELVALRLQ